MKECPECHAEHNRITPLLKPAECLRQHKQYICGTCGRCICIDRDPRRHVQRWNFPFQTAEIANLYLRTAEATRKQSCGIYQIQTGNRTAYRIFADLESLQKYLRKNPEKSCDGTPVYPLRQYQEFPGTQIRHLTAEEAGAYLKEQEHA